MNAISDRAQDPVIDAALADELDNFRGQWVAVFRNHVIAAGSNAMEVAEQAHSEGASDPLLFRVPAHPSRMAFL